MANLGSSAVPRKLKILMIHGFTQSGHVFEIKTKALKKALEKHFPPAPRPGHLKEYPGGVELHYPTGPIRLDAADIPGADVDGEREPSEAYGWWRRRGTRDSYTYDGFERGLSSLAEVLATEGPFDGAIGFSQGGAAAGMIASLLEPGRQAAFTEAQKAGGLAFPERFADESGGIVHPPLRFAVSYSGYAATTYAPFRAFYEPKISTPMCHFIGSVDTVVEEAMSLRLVDACVDGRGHDGGVPRVVYHPGGHFLPSSQKQYVSALVAFIREALGANEAINGSRREERAEDMELPF